MKWRKAMKAISWLGFCWLLVTLPARADLVTASLTLTNTPTNGYTITINAGTLTWTNTPTTSLHIGNTNSVGAATTNLFNALVLAGVSGLQQVYYTATNRLSLVGVGLTASVSTNWATLTLTTNATTNSMYVVVPYGAIAVASAATNMYSLAVSALELSTNAASTNALWLSNYMGLTTTQTVSGAKTFTGPNMWSNVNQQIIGGQISLAGLTSLTNLSGTNGLYFSLFLVNPVLTNGQNYGDPFRSPGSGSGSEQFGTSSTASGDNSVAFGKTARGTAIAAAAIGYGALASGNSSTALGSFSVADGSQSSALGNAAEADGLNSVAIGEGATAAFDYSAAIGSAAVPTAAHQIAIGTSTESIYLPGGLEVDGSISNAVFSGSVTLNNELIVASFANSSLANGNNAAVNLSTNAYVVISGPSAAFATCGLAGGAAGRVVTLEFDHAPTAPWTIANDSGVEPTAANRIYTGLTADYTITNNPAVATFRYNGTLTRWVLVSHN